MWFLPGGDFRRTSVIMHVFLLFWFVDSARTQELQISPCSSSTIKRELATQCYNRDLSHAIKLFLLQTTEFNSACPYNGLSQDFAPSIPNFPINHFYSLCNKIRDSRLVADSILTFCLSYHFVVFWEPRTIFRPFEKIKDFDKKLEMSMSGGCRTLDNSTSDSRYKPIGKKGNSEEGSATKWRR
jgi:hypothetical protein